MTIKNKLIREIPKNEYDTDILYYADKAINGEDILETLKNSKLILEISLSNITDDEIQHKYGHGKWTVGQVLQHVISYERIMTEKALIIAGELQDGFKYQIYSQASTAKGGLNKTKSQLVKEFIETRDTTIQAFKKLNNKQLKSIGYLDGFKTSVRMLSFCISGHQVHHFQILKNKYNVL